MYSILTMAMLLAQPHSWQQQWARIERRFAHVLALVGNLVGSDDAVAC